MTKAAPTLDAFKSITGISMMAPARLESAAPAPAAQQKHKYQHQLQHKRAPQPPPQASPSSKSQGVRIYLGGCVCGTSEKMQSSKTQGGTACDWDCDQRSYQWHGILKLITSTCLPSRRTLSWWWDLFLFCFSCFKLLFPPMTTITCSWHSTRTIDHTTKKELYQHRPQIANNNSCFF